MSQNTAENEIIFSCRQVSKHFGPIVACDLVDLDIRRGEILAIVGDNGAGKTTLVKILTGAMTPDSGQLLRNNNPIAFESTRDAHANGIEAVYQELALAPNLDVTSNIFLGRELFSRIGFLPYPKILARKKMKLLARKEIDRLGINIRDVSGQVVGKMSGGQRQSVAIARSVYWTSDILFMDEPTAALGVKESKAVLSLIKKVADTGVAIVMISHAMPHVLQLADRVVVMRHGMKVEDRSTENITVEELVKMIVGA
jgi:ABC-type sugar transport system ATPase subunit|uniref:ATP-binding cassette domain-containing protein n=1 Tax=Candidatus Planktophila sp. TaxID=2175601 RepID=UPI004049049A